MVVSRTIVMFGVVHHYLDVDKDDGGVYFYCIREKNKIRVAFNPVGTIRRATGHAYDNQ